MPMEHKMSQTTTGAGGTSGGSHKDIWIEAAYKKLVEQFRAKDEKFHSMAFLGVVTLAVVQLWSLLANPLWLQGLDYTPGLWLAGLLSYLLVAPFLRYSKLNVLKWFSKDANEKRTHFHHGAQWAIVVISVAALVIEIIGIFSIFGDKFTISRWLRDTMDVSVTLYWVFGIFTGILAGLIIDLKNLPEVIKLCLIAWIAVLTHICWWLA